MGRPNQVKPPLTGSNRREFFKRSGATTVALVAAAPQLSFAAAPTVFQHGVASGDPLSDRVILWTRVSPASAKPSVSVAYVVATDPGLLNIVKRGSSKTHPGRDYTVKVDALGLQPGTTYYYQFTAEGAASPVGRTKTLPVGPTQRLRMAVVSCSNHAHGYFNAYARIAQRADLDLVMHLGDYLYEYGNGQYGSLRPTEPAHEIVSLSDYRQRHAQYKRDADSQAMHRQHPLLAIWDDHESANDAYKTGAQNHQGATEGDWEARVAAALQAYYEWMPVRPVDVNNLRKNNRLFAYGDLAELVMLEQRLSGRSQQLAATVATPLGPGFVQAGAFTDPGRSLLGSEQEQWLSERLRSTPARWKLLGQGVMFAQLKGVAATNAAGGGVFLNADQWDGYQPARERIYAVLKGDAQHAPVDNVVVLTGDIHSSWAADLTQDPNNPNPAGGGYNPATGEGSRAVEFVGTSVSSPGIDTDGNGAIAGFLRSINPHFKYINLHRRGYMLLDLTPQRAVCEWWYVDTVASPSNNETFAAAFEVQQGSNRLSPSAQTLPPAHPPLLAP
ncbi:alkaline phosphatase D family protein [Paucibacter sp. XJ19-41]|uniref:alkaline phosphatase D family protein n=1 Tax=Paucibacter sp. XJ19-41 TaxID=2927824 RepID=UPI00234B1658|nr:alkaline phosphatase D family protein [Paucibacter sp. XJ19-41]MDC6170484.1 alkaline phosphatase D family protein [Paucibacter sp. XJ19-41]